MSQWARLCARKDLKYGMERQTDHEDDLLKYLRKWNTRNTEELTERILAHPLEDVRFFWWNIMIMYNETQKPHEEPEDIGSNIDNVMYVWNRVKKYEKLQNHRYEDFQGAVDEVGFEWNSRREPPEYPFRGLNRRTFYNSSTDLEPTNEPVFENLDQKM